MKRDCQMRAPSRSKIARLAGVADVLLSGCVHSQDDVRPRRPGAPLPGTKPLTMTGDIASELVAGADRFLLKQIEESAAKREKPLEAGFLVASSLSGFG